VRIRRILSLKRERREMIDSGLDELALRIDVEKKVLLISVCYRIAPLFPYIKLVVRLGPRALTSIQYWWRMLNVRSGEFGMFGKAPTPRR
jgi:hypothetical protein